MHRPDGVPDILQQIEHGTLAILGGYDAVGPSYRGIICRDPRQYVLLGDGSVMTDNIAHSQHDTLQSGSGPKNDDRLVFTENNPRRELYISACLAAASRALRGYNDTLSQRALEMAEITYNRNSDSEHLNNKIIALTELILADAGSEYLESLTGIRNYHSKSVHKTAWAVARIFDRINQPAFQRGYWLGVQSYFQKLKEESSENPFGVPFNPGTWGSAWGIERFGSEQYFLYKHLQIEDAKTYMINSLNYVLGVHPGENTASFVSGVGTRSVQVAYGVNRADWSSIPGGVISGTAYVKPDFPELKNWPYLWQQTEYVIGGAASNFMFLVLGTREIIQ
jgi:hypothetical protein